MWLQASDTVMAIVRERLTGLCKTVATGAVDGFFSECAPSSCAVSVLGPTVVKPASDDDSGGRTVAIFSTAGGREAASVSMLQTPASAAE